MKTVSFLHWIMLQVFGDINLIPKLIGFRTKNKEFRIFLGDDRFFSNIRRVGWGSGRGMVEQGKPQAFKYVTSVDQVSTCEYRLPKQFSSMTVATVIKADVTR